jgi:acyl carrier protein
MTAPVFDRVRTIAADVFGVPATEITPQSAPETVANWDSVQHLNLLLALEEAFDVQFEPEEMDAMHDVEQILAVLDAKLKQRV